MWRLTCDILDVALALVVRATRLCWRFRAGMVPAWTALAVAAGAAVLPGRWWWAPITVALILAPPLFWAGSRLTEPWQRVLSWLVPDWLDDGRKGVLDRETERGYLALLLLLVGSWVSWLALHGWDDVTRWVFLGSALAGGIPWWIHRGWRRRKRPNRWAMRWRHVGESIKEFEGSRVIAHSGDKLVTELKVVLRPGLTINNVGDRGLQVASALSPRLRPGAVTLSSGGAARRVSVRIVPRDPWQGVIPHPMPPLGSVDLDRDDRVMIGRLEDRRVLLLKMRLHTLVCGATGSGKSVALDALLVWMTLSRSPKVAIDMASGVTLGEWEPTLAAPLATNAGQAMELLAGVMNVVEHRERQMKQLKVKEWPHNDLFVVIDEFPTLVRVGGKQVVQILTILAERARKTRVWLYPAAQNGTKDDLGSTEFRAQMRTTLGLRLDRHMSRLLWGDLEKQGWDSTNLQTGTMLLRDPTRNEPRVAKGVFTTDAEREQLIRDVKRAGGIALDSGSARALRGEVETSAPFGTTLVDVKPGAESLAEQHAPRRLTVVQSARSPLDELDERVLEELPHVEQATVGPGALAEQLAVSRDQIKRSLARLSKRGQAMTPKHGQWGRTS